MGVVTLTSLECEEPGKMLMRDSDIANKSYEDRKAP
jgi:hypothetical protein